MINAVIESVLVVTQLYMSPFSLTRINDSFSLVGVLLSLPLSSGFSPKDVQLRV